VYSFFIESSLKTVVQRLSRDVPLPCSSGSAST